MNTQVKIAFESWFGAHSDALEKARLFEMREGEYIFMTTRTAWASFNAGFDAQQGDIRA